MLQENNVDIIFKKCEFYKNTIHYLGFVLTENGYEADLKKIESFLNELVCTNITEVKSVMGNCNIIVSVIPCFVYITVLVLMNGT